MVDRYVFMAGPEYACTAANIALVDQAWTQSKKDHVPGSKREPNWLAGLVRARRSWGPSMEQIIGNTVYLVSTRFVIGCPQNCLIGAWAREVGPKDLEAFDQEPILLRSTVYASLQLR